MNILTLDELNRNLQSPGSIYNNLTYKIISEEIRIPTESAIQSLYTYTFKIAPDHLTIANDLILNTIKDSKLLLAYSFDIILTNNDTTSFYKFVGHNYFSLYDPNAENLLQEVSRLELQQYINEINLDPNNVLKVNSVKSDLSMYRILCVNIFVVSAFNLRKLLT